MTAYVIKYAATGRIIKVECEIRAKDSDTIITGANCKLNFYHGKNKEWCETIEEAVKYADQKRNKKIKSLEKQIEKLKNINFKEATK